jgi:hypothetical protein
MRALCALMSGTDAVDGVTARVTLPRLVERLTMHRLRTQALIVMMSAFLVAGIVALIRNSESGALYCGVFALLAMYAAIPKRPSQDGGLATP